jgi:hypothetical protein
MISSILDTVFEVFNKIEHCFQLVEVEEMWPISANHRLKLQKCHEGQRKMT